jgi:hypothetical protein
MKNENLKSEAATDGTMNLNQQANELLIKGYSHAKVMLMLLDATTSTASECFDAIMSNLTIKEFV